MLSIVTPTYNRAHLLQKCYDSLAKQSLYDFEWIIIDDGSTDDTKSVVDNFNTSLFPIVYVQKENGGKHTALNESHKYINGEYVLILDSDDSLVPTAVEQVLNSWKCFKYDKEIGIVIFLRGKNEFIPYCKAKDCDERKKVNGLRYQRLCIHSSDCCEVIQSKLFKRYPFPVFLNEKFVPESVLWSRVYYEYKCVYINEVIYLCEYLDGGLTKLGRAMRLRNPNGGMANSLLLIDKRNRLKTRIKNGLLYTCYGFFAGMSLKEITNNNQKLLTLMCLPFGYVLYLYWRIKYDISRT